MAAGRQADIQITEAKLELALECLTASGRLTLRVAGSSMLPAICPGSGVVIRRVRPDELTVGDLVLSRTSDGVRLHRLVEIRGRGAETLWLTRGDNIAECDAPLTSAQILGVCVQVEPPARSGWFRRMSSASRRFARLAA